MFLLHGLRCKSVKAPFQSGGVELTLVLVLLEEPGLYESAPPCHYGYTPMLTHASVGLQHPSSQLTQL